MEHGSHVIHKLHISLMEVVWHLNSFCVFGVIWPYDLTMTRAEEGYMQVRGTKVSLPMSSTNEIRFVQLVKICWKHVSVSQGSACSHSQKQENFCGVQHDPKLLWMYRAQVVEDLH